MPLDGSGEGVFRHDKATCIADDVDLVQPMNERYIKWHTPWLSRDFEMIAFGNGGGLPLIIYPTSFGRYYQNKDFHLIDAIAWYIDNGKITVYCPDAIDLESFYNKNIHPADRMKTHNAYENVILHDVFDLARRECNAHRVASSSQVPELVSAVGDIHATPRFTNIFPLVKDSANSPVGMDEGGHWLV